MPETDLSLLEKVAREAGEIALGFWRDDPQVWDKGHNDPVTEADLAVDNHLKTRFLTARPDYGWVSEETEDDPARLAAERVFICDPIDGTRAFVAGEPTWAHSLAVVDHGKVIAASVFLPAHDKMYLAAIREGATLNGNPIHASQRSSLDGAEILGPKINYKPDNWQGGKVPDIKRQFRPSLAYRLALAADGQFDGMLTLRPCWEWDIAAGALIASEAGAGISDRKGYPLIFNTPDRLLNGVVAGAPSVHSDIISRLA